MYETLAASFCSEKFSLPDVFFLWRDGLASLLMALPGRLCSRRRRFRPRKESGTNHTMDIWVCLKIGFPQPFCYERNSARDADFGSWNSQRAVFSPQTIHFCYLHRAHLRPHIPATLKAKVKSALDTIWQDLTSQCELQQGNCCLSVLSFAQFDTAQLCMFTATEFHDLHQWPACLQTR